MNNGLVTCRNKAGTPAGLIVTSDRLYVHCTIPTYMDVGIVIQRQYLTSCKGAIGDILRKKSVRKKIFLDLKVVSNGTGGGV